MPEQPARYSKTVDLPLRLGMRALQARLDYTSDEPHAVVLTITEKGRDIVWRFDRALLRDGCSVPAGDGDVRIQPGSHASRIRITLGHSKADPVTLEGSVHLAVVFLDRIYQAVPEGREHEWMQLDREIEELFMDAEGGAA